MRKLLINGILLLSIFFSATAQVNISEPDAVGRAHAATTFATDYRAVGINAANLGMPMEYETKKITFGLMEFNSSISTNAFTKGEFFDALGSNQSLSYQGQLDLINDFTNTDFGMNIDVSPLNFAVQIPKVGGFAFGSHVRTQFYSSFGESIVDLVTLGQASTYWDSLRLTDGSTVVNDPSQTNIDSLINNDLIDFGFIDPANALTLSQLFDGTRVSGSSYIEYNISYGREVLATDFLNLYAGVGLKMIQGIAMIDVQVDEGSGFSNAFISVSPKLESLAERFGDPSAFYDPKNYSLGFGADIGISAIYKERFKFGAAVNNIGAVKWDGIVWQLQDSIVVEFDEAGITSGGFEGYWQAALNSGDLGDAQQIESQTIQLPTTMRIGAGYKILDKAQVGLDIVIPLNKVGGNIDRPLIAVGGDFKPVRWFKLSSGFNLGATGSRVNIPLGITFIAGEFGTWEAGFATRDIVTFVSDVGPTLSAAFGFLRFRI